jgi:predicted negative regulator of RcsB-dependent stress response
VTATDDEQLDKLREFWTQYGKTIIAGIILGLAALAAWAGWQSWQAKNQTAAAIAFHQIEQLSAANQPKQAMEAARKLAESDQGSVYATLALMIGAHEAMSQNDPAKAAIYLNDAMQHAKQPSLAALAQLRLARVQWSENKPEQALATLKAKTPPKAYESMFTELTGDIQASQKNWAAARAAYEQVLKSPDSANTMVQIKLDNLPAASVATSAPTASGKEKS